VLVLLALGCGPKLAAAPPAPAPSAHPSATPGSAPNAAPSAAPTSGPAAPSSTAPAAPASSAPPPTSARATATEAPKPFDGENVYAADRAAAAAQVPLLDASGKPLPQTDARPTTTSASFQARMELVARAIATGDADLALPAFFPEVAYAQVKDIPKPERDWAARLVRAFRRDIAEYHQKLGPSAPKATFAGVKVAEARAKFMKPGSEGNRVGYYRVLRSTLTFRLPSGEERSLELTSMISWRGEWYVVHLHGFK
jgi:hypothetical protein